MAQHREQDLQISVIRYLRVVAPDLLYWAVPNAIGIKNTARAGALNKRMGVRAGVADLNFILADGKAAFIELKVEGAYQRPTQKAFQADVEARGCAYVVCRSLDDVRVTLEEWGVPLRIADSKTIDGRDT